MEPGILMRGGRVIDPSRIDGVADVRIAGGLVEEVGSGLGARAGERVVDVSGLLVTPGLLDVHVHLREPGLEAKETIATGALAAAAGGFTTVCAMPNTDPVTDTPDRVQSILERGRAAGAARVLPVAAATVGSRGERLTDVAALALAGAVAISDDGLPIATGELLASALVAAREAGIVVADHCEDQLLSAGGAVHVDAARRLGVGGIPPEAESEAVARDLEVLARVGGRLHVCHVSTAGTVDRLREARAAGLPVTAEVCPHHLTLTWHEVVSQGARAKMNPPLASHADREALVAALLDGTIDCVATDHAPHTAEEKAWGVAAAPFGVTGLETAFGVLHTDLVRRGRMALPVLIERLTVGPARAFGLAGGTLDAGAPGDLAVFDLEAGWEVDPDAFWSRSRNSPWIGRRLTGRAVLTLVGGRVVHDLLSPHGGILKR
ncbi:MAG: dihydroorotase [Gemmatimonadota bacterium]